MLNIGGEKGTLMMSLGESLFLYALIAVLGGVQGALLAVAVERQFQLAAQFWMLTLPIGLVAGWILAFLEVGLVLELLDRRRKRT